MKNLLNKHIKLLPIFLALGIAFSYAQKAAKPNIVLIYTDDQRFDALGVIQQEQGAKARFPWFKTPHLDRLVAEGALFRNAFVTHSLCSPSRATLLTGKYSHLNGIVNNHTALTDTLTTYATELRKNNYTTGFFGKWHMGNQSGKRQGFDHSASFIGQGRYFDCPLEVDGVTQETKGWVDDVVTDHALDFIQNHKNEPFVAVIAFKSGHGPFQPAHRHEQSFSDVSIGKAATADLEPPYKGKIPVKRNTNQTNNKNRAPSEEGDKKIKNYFRTLTGVDDNVGRILHVLDSLELADNTLLVFTSDNGFFLGEHGLGDKRAAYEASIRIPLIVKYPKQVPAGKQVQQIVLNLDIAPTLLDVAGIEIPSAFQGKSLLPLAKGEKIDWRKSFLYEYFYENNFAIPTIKAVRTEDAKLITYPGNPEWNELYNLKIDPLETKNLYGNPSEKGLKAKLERELEKLAKDFGYNIPPYADKLLIETR